LHVFLEIDFMRTPIFLALLLCVLLSACATFNPPAKQHKAALDDFMYALRWQLYPEAAAYFTSEHREEFLDRMENLKDLNVTEVRLKRVELTDAGRHAETLMEMDYYILPSTTLKTLQFKQSWKYLEAEAAGSGFLITTPFPKFP